MYSEKVCCWGAIYNRLTLVHLHGVSWRLKSPATQLFVQQLIQVKNKEIIMNLPVTHRGTQDAMTTSLLRQNDTAMSFWRNNDVIIASCAHRVAFPLQWGQTSPKCTQWSSHSSSVRVIHEVQNLIYMFFLRHCIELWNIFFYRTAL